MYTLLIKDGPDTDADIEAELADEPPPAAVPALAVHAAPALALAGVSNHDGAAGIRSSTESE
jgi:hypothetical protein